jgi:recombinational DNA repair protein RecT
MEQQKAITVTLQHLESLKPTEIANDDRVKTMFVKNFNSIHKSAAGDQVYELEKYYFGRAVSTSAELKKCTKLSLYATFIEMAVQGLSFDPGKKLCYLVPQNVNVGTKENAQWEARAALEISPYGELAIRQAMGQIKSADNPEVVYEGEHFEVSQTPTGKQVDHKFKFPRAGKMIACYMRIVKSDGFADYFILDAAGMERLKQYSSKKNKGFANALYGNDGKQPDEGFWKAKTIKHAFKAYPKVKLPGQFSKLQEDPEDNDEAPVIDYGMQIQAPEAITLHQEIAPVVNINPTTTDTAKMTTTVIDEDSGEVITHEDELDF